MHKNNYQVLDSYFLVDKKILKIYNNSNKNEREVFIMEKKQSNFKIIIALLVIIIVLLIGFIIFFVGEFIDERDEIRYLYNENNKTSTDNTTNITTTNDNNSSNQNYISRENALKVALDDAKINQNDIRDIDVELDYKYNQTVYEVTFDYQQYEYEYYINAENGSIVKSFKERD